ncbi:MAG: hypothetical protein ACOCV1_03560 [Bacillota bacterium]
MKFKDYLGNKKLSFKKKTRKKLGAGRKESRPFNPRLSIPIVGEDPHSKTNRDRRYIRRKKKEGIF